MRIHIIYTAIIALLLFFLNRSCNKVVGTSTQVVYRQVRQSESHVPQPVQVIQASQIPETKTVYQKISSVDSFIVFEREKVDTGAILKDYFATVYYADTSHNQYGYVVIKDTVTQNRIVNRRVDYNLSVPETTITKTILPKPKNEYYAGVLTTGNALGGSILLKTKSNRMYEAGLTAGFNGIHILASVKFQLFNKNKN